MTEFLFQSLLLEKNNQDCKNYIQKNLKYENLISILRDLIFLSVSVKFKNKSKIHPIIIINIIKNIISDNRKKPSKILISFFIDYLLKFDLRKNDKLFLNKVSKDGIGAVAFIGDLEDSYQNNKWDNAELMTAKFFLASDRTRATFDILAELALQNIKKNGLFVFHIMRAYEFKKSNEDNWLFTMCLMSFLKGVRLPKPHSFSKQNPETIKNDVLLKGDLILYSSMLRLWEGDYVRKKGYQREISNWCSENIENFNDQKKITAINWLFESRVNRFIDYAESVIIAKNKSDYEKINELIFIDSFRALFKNLNFKQICILKERFKSF